MNLILSLFFLDFQDRGLLWDDLLYAVNMDYSHCLIMKVVWPMARQDKIRQSSQTVNLDEERQSQGHVSQMFKKQDARGPVKP